MRKRQSEAGVLKMDELQALYFQCDEWMQNPGRILDTHFLGGVAEEILCRKSWTPIIS